MSESRKAVVHKTTRRFDDFFKIDEVTISHERADGTKATALPTPTTATTGSIRWPVDRCLKVLLASVSSLFARLDTEFAQPGPQELH